MKRRLSDSYAGDKSQERVAKKNERTHEENQERAYIAASRRGDRSLEARMASARMASDIHMQRTGKRFKITEEIVRKEEMYEEEEDDIPRYRCGSLGLPFHTSLANRAGAYVLSQVELAQLQRHADVDIAFAQAFPGATRALPPQQFAHPVRTHHYHDPNHPLMHYPISQQQYHGVPQFSPPPQPPTPQRRDRTQSMAQLTPRHDSPFIPQAQGFPLPRSRHGSMDERSPPALTPGSTRTETPTSAATPPQDPIIQYPAPQRHPDRRKIERTTVPLEPAAGIPQVPSDPSSPFTSELPNNAKALLSFNMEAMVASQMMMSDRGRDLLDTGYCTSPFTTGNTFEEEFASFVFNPSIPLLGTPAATKMGATDYANSSLLFPDSNNPFLEDAGYVGIGTQPNGQDDKWEDFINVEAAYGAVDAENASADAISH